MKYMKSYKVFETYPINVDNTIGLDLQDICLELEDEGFDISFGSHETSGNPYTPTYLYYVRINKNKTLYQYSEQLKEVCERIKDYLGDNFKDLYISTISGEDYNGILIPESTAGFHKIGAVIEINLYFTI